MYATGVDPRTLQGNDPKSMKKVYIPSDPHEKAMQRALMQFRDPKLYSLVKEALVCAHREDLIGYGQKCLIRPEKAAGGRQRLSARGNQGATSSGKKSGSSSGGQSLSARGKNSSSVHAKQRKTKGRK
jgi:hypothetical protein